MQRDSQLSVTCYASYTTFDSAIFKFWNAERLQHTKILGVQTNSWMLNDLNIPRFQMFKFDLACESQKLTALLTSLFIREVDSCTNRIL